MEITKAFLLSTLCTFLTSCVGQDTSVRLPEFVTHPKEYSYIVQNKPVTLTCEAYDAMEITFSCLGAKMDTARQTTYQSYHPDTDRELVKTTMDVDYNDVQGFEDYWCECYAWAPSSEKTEGGVEPTQYTLSRRGFVMVPYLQKEFLAEPESEAVSAGTEVALRCVPPEANPEPRIVWNKDGVRIDPHANTNLRPTKYGTLIIVNFQASDAGDYSCVVKNLAGMRESRPATLSVQDYVASETHLFSDELSDEPASGAVFEQSPQGTYYVSDSGPVEMTCGVRGATILEFRCNGARVDEKKINKQETGPRGSLDSLITSTYTVTAKEVDTFKTQYQLDFTCLCYAWYMVDRQWKGIDTAPSTFIVSETATKPPKTPTTATPGQPHFTVDLKENYYTFSKKPAELKCTFTMASIMTVRCNGVRLPQDRVKVEQEYDRKTNIRTLDATVEIMANEVKAFVDAENDVYTCVCVGWFTKEDSSWGTTESLEAKVLLGFLESKFIVEPEDMTMSAGRTVVFDCVPPMGGPEPDVYWSKDGVDIDTSDERFEVTADGGLTIFDLQLDDAGQYMCVAENGAGVRYSSEASLVVEGEGGGSTDTVVIMEPETEAPEPETTFRPETTTVSDLASGIPIYIKQPDKVTYITRNKPAVITCKTLGAEHLIFECNGQRIPEGFQDSQLVIDPETGKKVLQRSINVTRQDYEAAGNIDVYTCVCSAWYSDVVNQKWSQLHRDGTVEMAFLRKTFQLLPKSQTVDAGSSVEMMCKAPKAKPKAMVSWKVDGITIDVKDDENVDITESGSLVINSVSKRNEGNYTCVADNIAGARSSTAAELTVIETAIAEPDPTETVDPVVSVVNEPPVFVQELEQEYYVVAGGSVKLTCTATNTGKITFSCNNMDVDENQVMLMNKEMNGEASLEAVLDVQSETVESLKTAYTCECLAWFKRSMNEPEQYVRSAATYVEFAYIEDEFQREPNSQESGVGQMVTFKCVVPRGFPRPEPSWNKNGEKIDLLSSGDLIMPSDGSLVIVQARISDAGSYSCSAKNIAGTRTSNEATLTVKGYGTTSIPEPEPETSPEMSAVNVTEDEVSVTSEVMPEAEQTTESVMTGNVTVENATISNEIGGKDDTTAEPEPGVTAVVDKDCKIREKCLGPFSPNQDMFNIHDSCLGLQEFLKCVHDVKVKCNGLDDMEKKLTDVADWFNEYCSRLPRKERVVEKCATYNSCPAPIVPETTLNDLIDIHFWCKYIQMTTECRQLALANNECKAMKKNKLKMDLHYLETHAAKFCVEEPVPEVTKPDIPVSVDEVEGPEPEKGSGSVTAASVLVSTLIQFLVILVISFR